MSTLPHELPAFDGGLVNVIVEVPRGSRSKFKYDPETGLFSVHRSLPAGFHFPYDYGFVPSTQGEDGDPLDALVFADTESFAGCLVKTRLVGVITGTQKGEKGRVANDILLAVHVEASSWKKVRSIGDVPAALLNEIEFFFVSYRNFQKKEFRPTGRKGTSPGMKLLRAGMARAKQG